VADDQSCLFIEGGVMLEESLSAHIAFGQLGGAG
jgi:hypothetical protein